jgi:hypothetical protein
MDVLGDTVPPMAGNVAHVTTKQYDLSKWVARGQVLESFKEVFKGPAKGSKF